MCGSQVCSKIAKFLPKEPSHELRLGLGFLHEHCSGAVDWLQQQFRFAQKGQLVTKQGFMVMMSKPKLPNENSQNSQD